jgi:hypothetical protein
MNPAEPTVPLRAVCDPLMLQSLVFADEDFYKGSDSRERLSIMGFPILTFCALASFVFDELLAQAQQMAGIKQLLGDRWQEKAAYDRVIGKFQKSGLFRFDLKTFIPRDADQQLNSVVTFIDDVIRSNHVAASIGVRQVGLSPPYQMLALSRFTHLPFISNVMDDGLMAPPSTETRGPRPQMALAQEILALELPDVHPTHVDDIFEIRNKKGAREFREVFRSFYRSVEADLDPSISADRDAVTRKWRQLKDEATDLLWTEFHEDIRGWQTVKVGASIILDFVGLIPFLGNFVSAVSFGKDSAEAFDHAARLRRAKNLAWVGFLTDLRQQSRKQRQGPVVQ